MLGGDIHILAAQDGTPVCNVSFDLSAAQLQAAALAVAETGRRRHRGEALDTDGVLALRALTSLSDELDRLVEQQGHATVILPLAQFTLLHDLLCEWSEELADRGWGRTDELEAQPLVTALLEPMASLRRDAVARAVALAGPAAIER